jgi:murein DD-endopeptidase MepM/ murein hydrolase activator NlpD
MDCRFSKFAALIALCLAPLMTACTESPETQLSWGVNDHLSSRRAAPVKTARADGPRTYVYQEALADLESPPVPTPRPAYRPQPSPRMAQVYEYRDDVRQRPADYRPASAPAPANAIFAWPVNGTVISGFGTARNGERNDGINIAARTNTPIRAAASGTVNYADSLSGYGNLVLIKHSNGYVTAYAHADRLLVAQGDYVMKGQVIGYAGQTGDVSSPQVHFEIRNGTTPVDPERYLAARAGA